MFFVTGTSWAQESRGSITGKVLDPQGAAIPAATVVITNVETNQVSRTSTNETGYFEVNFLNPGKYRVSAELSGFKRLVRSGLDLPVAGRLDLQLPLEIGTQTETMQVTAEAALLETTVASGGRVVDSRQVMELPFSDMNAFALSALASGMQWTGQPEYRRPFDNGGTSAFNTMGGVGQNEYSIDGAPVTGTGRRVGFVPPSDAIDQFKLETSTFDASYGHTSGATINVMTKAGTNTFHGSLYDQHWQQRWNATPHFTRLAFERDVREGRKQADDQRQATGRSNNFGGTIGGPVRIPKLYNGTDKLFFFFSYNGIYQSKAETTDSINRDVPKMAWRQGDFSDLQALDAVKYTVYDPRSARQEGARVVRMPFPGNKGVPVLNPVYKFYEPLYPKPNDVPGVVSPEGLRNYYALAMPKDEEFNSIVNRVDYNISDNHRLFGRWYWNHRLADEYDWTYETARGIHTNGLTRINKGAGGNYIWTLSGTSVLDIGVNFNRFNEGDNRPIQAGYKPSDVGLPAYLDAKADQYHVLPRLDFEELEDFSSTYPAITIRGSTGEVKAQMSTVTSTHSLRYGWQERRYWTTTAGPGYSSGRFQHNNTYMRAADNATTASNIGLEWASFMMGLPANDISIQTQDTGYWSTRYRALYIQDDWRLTDRLRLNLGLRYEREAGITERFNRGLSGYLDFNYRPAFADIAEAAYAKSALAELPAAQFKVLGGNDYLGAKYKTFTDGTHFLLPRIGAVYQINPKTVIRTGYGWFYDTFNTNNTRPAQDGFSQDTTTARTNDLGLTFCCGVGAAANLSAANNPMVNPFPVRADGTRFDVPYGNSLGGIIRQGRGFDFYPRDYQPAWQQRWRFGVQREITKDMVIEASYNGAFSRIWAQDQWRVNYLPQQFWATGNVRNQTLEDDLNRNVPNPFHISNFAALQTSNPAVYRYLTTQSFFTSTTIRKHALLRPFPNFGTNNLRGVRPGVDFKDAQGGNKYHDLQLQFERRFSRGFQTAVMYTYAHGEESDNYYNEFDVRPTYRPQNDIRPHRFVWSAIYELPFGKGRSWVSSGPLQHVIGGWQLSWVYQYQNGGTTDWGNRFFYGDLDNIAALFRHEEVNSADIHQWFDPNIRVSSGSGAIPSGFQGFEGRTAMQPGSYHVRMFPTRLSALRQDGIRNWDVKVKRVFKITEQLRTSFDIDMLNATNHTNFAAPQTDPTRGDFGQVTTQRGLSRVFQFNLRLDF
jgi:hypothetical protein